MLVSRFFYLGTKRLTWFIFSGMVTLECHHSGKKKIIATAEKICISA
jgi:hypothetical protein